MKTIEELHEEMIEAQTRQRRAIGQMIAEKIMQAPDCRTSKRELLGLNKKHKTTELPLFEPKTLF
jgi:hypothetical protein